MNMFHSLGNTGVLLCLSAIVGLTSGFASPTQSAEQAIDGVVKRSSFGHGDAKCADRHEDECHPGVDKTVKAFILHYITTLEGGNEKAIRALFVDDDRFAWFTDGAKSYSSIDDVLAEIRRYAGIRFETTVSEIRVLPLNASLEIVPFVVEV